MITLSFTIFSATNFSYSVITMLVSTGSTNFLTLTLSNGSFYLLLKEIAVFWQVPKTKAFNKQFDNYVAISFSLYFRYARLKIMLTVLRREAVANNQSVSKEMNMHSSFFRTKRYFINPVSCIKRMSKWIVVLV